MAEPQNHSVLAIDLSADHLIVDADFVERRDIAATGEERMKRAYFGTAIALAVTTATPMSAVAQDYPSRSIRFVVPFTAGSATDSLARVLGQKLTAAHGWTIVIENIAGASGQTAASNVARAAP